LILVPVCLLIISAALLLTFVWIDGIRSKKDIISKKERSAPKLQASTLKITLIVLENRTFRITEELIECF